MQCCVLNDTTRNPSWSAGWYFSRFEHMKPTAWKHGIFYLGASACLLLPNIICQLPSVLGEVFFFTFMAKYSRSSARSTSYRLVICGEAFVYFSCFISCLLLVCISSFPVSVTTWLWLYLNKAASVQDCKMIRLLTCLLSGMWSHPPTRGLRCDRK